MFTPVEKIVAVRLEPPVPGHKEGPAVPWPLLGWYLPLGPKRAP